MVWDVTDEVVTAYLLLGVEVYAGGMLYVLCIMYMYELYMY